MARGGQADREALISVCTAYVEMRADVFGVTLIRYSRMRHNFHAGIADAVLQWRRQVLTEVKTMRTVAGGVVAVVLLGLYAWLIATAAGIALCTGAGCAAYTTFDAGMTQALGVVTGLVSALVIAELAVTPAGAAPAARLLPQTAGSRARLLLRWVTAIYLLVWLVAGLAAFVIGLLHPGALPALTHVGQAWFGIAVAAAYAWLGLKPTG